MLFEMGRNKKGVDFCEHIWRDSFLVCRRLERGSQFLRCLYESIQEKRSTVLLSRAESDFDCWKSPSLIDESYYLVQNQKLLVITVRITKRKEKE